MYQHRPTFLSDQQESYYYERSCIYDNMDGHCWAGFLAVHKEDRHDEPSSHSEGFGHEGTARIWAGSFDHEQGAVCPKLLRIPFRESGAVHFADSYTYIAVFCTYDSAVMSPAKEE